MQIDISKPSATMLQLALDTLFLNEAKKVLNEVADLIDIIELGTPFILRYGIRAIEVIKKMFPHLKLLADFKIADAGKYESQLAFDAGADIVTVLATSKDSTIKAAIKQAEKSNKSIMVDMIGVDSIDKRAAEVDKMNVDYICAHTGYDEQNLNKNPLTNLLKIKKSIIRAKIAVAGGIKLSNLEKIMHEKPDIVIIGSGIINCSDIRLITIKIKKIINLKRYI